MNFGSRITKLLLILKPPTRRPQNGAIGNETISLPSFLPSAQLITRKMRLSASFICVILPASWGLQAANLMSAKPTPTSTALFLADEIKEYRRGLNKIDSKDSSSKVCSVYNQELLDLS
jgi:hypothetical protein